MDTDDARTSDVPDPEQELSEEAPSEEARAEGAPAGAEATEDAGGDRPTEALRGLAKRFLRTGTEFVMSAAHEHQPTEPEAGTGTDEAKRRPLRTVASLAGRGKNELGKLALGELRTILEAMDITELLSRYSLEVKASIRLKDLAKPIEERGAGTDQDGS